MRLTSKSAPANYTNMRHVSTIMLIITRVSVLLCSRYFTKIDIIFKMATILPFISSTNGKLD